MKRSDFLFLWHSVAAYVRSGYGSCTRHIVGRLAKRGFKFVTTHYYGIDSGGVLIINGVPALPAKTGSFGELSVRHYVKTLKPNMAILHTDPWAFPWFPTLPCLTMSYGPLDHILYPENLQDLMRQYDYRVAPAKFTVEEWGSYDPPIHFDWIPHGVDTSIYKPMDKKKAKQFYKIDPESFVIGMVGANSDKEPRKNWTGMLKAIRIFLDNNPDVRDIRCIIYTNPKDQRGVDIELFLRKYKLADITITQSPFVFESVPGYSPIIIRTPDNKLEILTLEELWDKIDSEIKRRGHVEYKDVPEGYRIIHSDSSWTRIKQISRHKYNGKILRIYTNTGLVDVTPNHSIYAARHPTGKRELMDAREVKAGYYLRALPLTHPSDRVDMAGNFVGTLDLAWFLGFFVAEGSVYITKAGHYVVSFSNKDRSLIEKARSIFESNFHNETFTYQDKDGVYKVVSYGQELYSWFRQFYTKDGQKRIPGWILRATDDVLLSFIEGYLAGDGHRYENGQFNFTSKSQILIQGLLWVLSRIMPERLWTLQIKHEKGQDYFMIAVGKDMAERSLTRRTELYNKAIRKWREEKQKLMSLWETVIQEHKEGKSVKELAKKYSLNEQRIYKWLKGAKPRVKTGQIARELGIPQKVLEHWIYENVKPRRIILEGLVKNVKPIDYNGYVYDIETEDHTFYTGIGPIKCHNTGIKDEEMARLYNAFDVLLHASYREGFGICMYEAMACGVPVIAHDFSSMTEAIVEENGRRHGWLAKTAVYVDTPIGATSAIPDVYDIAKCIDKAYFKEKQRKRYGRYAREFALKFDWDRIVDDMWVPYLDRIIEESKPKPLKDRRLV